MDSRYRRDPALHTLLLGDGRPILALAACGLIGAGGFAFFLAATSEFLPHDVAWLGMTADELRRLADGRVADFMFHDRVAFGGTLVAAGIIYLWLVAVPLTAGEPWAWWVLCASSGMGFASFMSCLGFGYLDTWHAVATMSLLVLFAVGLARTRGLLKQIPHGPTPTGLPPWRTTAGIGRAFVLLTGAGMVLAGMTILILGTVVVFVPQDLVFIGFGREQLDAMNPRLVPLIAHDRAGFGGGLMSSGLAIIGCIWFAPMSRSLWEALLIAGGVGFASAIGIHGPIGYLDSTHVGPAVVAAMAFAVGMALVRPHQAGTPSATLR